jgi:hypothetical protein
MSDAGWEAGLIGYGIGRATGLNQGRDEGFADGESEGYTAGFHAGRIHGHQEGRQAGYQEGLRAGHEKGSDDGWNAAIAKANPEIEKAHRIIADLQADRERLLAAIDDRRGLGEILEARVEAAEACNIQLLSKNEELCTTNMQLESERRAVIDQLETVASERNHWIERHNEIVTFLAPVRAILNELVTGDSRVAQHVRAIFSAEYSAVIADALEKGDIACPLDEKPEFMEAFPATHRALRLMLDAAEKDALRTERETESAMAEQL